MMLTRVAMSQIQAVMCRKVLLTAVLSWQPVDCLKCSDTEGVAINSTWKKFQKKVWASCNIAKGCLWLEAQLKWIGDSCQAVWESDYEIHQNRAGTHSQGRSPLL